MRRQGQSPQDVCGLMDRNERLLVPQRHPVPQVAHVEVGPQLQNGLAPSVQLIRTQSLVLAGRFGHRNSEVQVRMLEQIVLQTRRADPAWTCIQPLAMQSTCKRQGQGQTASAWRSSQKQGVCQCIVICSLSQLSGQNGLSYRLAGRVHGSKIIALRRWDSNAVQCAHLAPER